MHTVWWQVKQQRREGSSFTALFFWRAEYIWTHLFCIILDVLLFFFLDWWFRQFLKASIWLNTKLKKLWNWHFCSPNNMNFSLVLSFHTYSKYVSDTSFSAVSSDKSPHCIRDLHTKADSWIFLGLPLIPFPSVNSSFKISYVKRYSTDV